MNKFALNRRILIVGEGRETEYNYFVGFRDAFEKVLQATATSVSVKRGNGGDAKGIVENAIKEAKRFQPDRRRGDCVFLLLDAEGPGTVPGKGRLPELSAAEKLAAKNGVEIVYSCPAIEYWLLCHFPTPSRGHFADCAAVINTLNKHWSSVCRAKYGKADPDVFPRLAKLLDKACSQGLQIDLHHLHSSATARRVNPSTQVYELVAILVGARSGENCPIAGTWKLLGDPSITTQLHKGGIMPRHMGQSVHWHL